MKTDPSSEKSVTLVQSRLFATLPEPLPSVSQLSSKLSAKSSPLVRPTKFEPSITFRNSTVEITQTISLLLESLRVSLETRRLVQDLVGISDMELRITLQRCQPAIPLSRQKETLSSLTLLTTLPNVNLTLPVSALVEPNLTG